MEGPSHVYFFLPTRFSVSGGQARWIDWFSFSIGLAESWASSRHVLNILTTKYQVGEVGWGERMGIVRK